MTISITISCFRFFFWETATYFQINLTFSLPCAILCLIQGNLEVECLHSVRLALRAVSLLLWIKYGSISFNLICLSPSKLILNKDIDNFSFK